MGKYSKSRIRPKMLETFISVNTFAKNGLCGSGTGGSTLLVALLVLHKLLDVLIALSVECTTFHLSVVVGSVCNMFVTAFCM